MLTQLIFDSFLFWVFLGVIVLTSIWIGKAAIRMHEYEKQVDRGWNDMIERTEKMIRQLDEIIFELEKTRKERETKPKPTIKK